MAFPIFPGAATRQSILSSRPHRFAYDFSMVDPGMFTPLPEKQVPQRPPRRHISYTIPLDDGYESDVYVPPENTANQSAMLNNRTEQNRQGPSSFDSQCNRDAHLLGINALQVNINPNNPGNRGGELYTAGCDGTVKVWDLDLPLKTSQRISSLGIPGDDYWRIDTKAMDSMNSSIPKLKHSSLHHVDWVNDIVTVDQGRTVISGSSDRSVTSLGRQVITTRPK